jgi:hypothetical protein
MVRCQAKQVEYVYPYDRDFNAGRAAGFLPAGGPTPGSIWSIRMFWLLLLPVIGLLTAGFLWDYKRRLDVLTGPWISDERTA